MRLLKLQTAMMRNRQHLYRKLLATLLSAGLLGLTLRCQTAQAQAMNSCQLSADEITQKDNLRKAALNGDTQAQRDYQALLTQQAQKVQQCRSESWPKTQAIWLRLYPCDAQSGNLEKILDRIVSKGYNQVYIEVFSDGQVLLPQAENRTPWPSVLRTPGTENIDLLAQAIEKGRERGLKVYAWLFTLNFGYSYALRPDRQQALARNVRGQTTLTTGDETGVASEVAELHANEAFVDPYNPQARQDYSWLVNSVLQRRPDGVLFDYVRYYRGTGPASVVSQVQHLWLYSEATQQALYQRALNQKGRELIRRYVSQGYISAADIEAVDRLYPNEGEPLWQGRVPPTPPAGSDPSASKAVVPAAQRQPVLQWELWYLSVAHAVQGVLDFLNLAIQPVQQMGLPAGAVFFPGGNHVVGQGFDSRLQAWDRFPSNIEWHPMVYGACGDVSCLVTQMERLVRYAPQGTKIIPAIAGDWGRSISNRPSLEQQMAALRQVAPQVDAISHFAYSWQEPESDRDRKFCEGQ